MIADPLHVVGDVGDGAEDLVLLPVAGQVGELTSSNQFVVSGLQGTWWPRVLAGEKTMPAKVIRELIDEIRALRRELGEGGSSPRKLPTR